MADFPGMTVWTDAYIADAGHLSDAEHGRYFLLLMLTWRSPECRIPNDDAWIARRMKRSVEDVKRDLRPILEEFFSTSGNWLFQKRLKREWEYQHARKKKQSAAAKRRWDKQKKSSGAYATDTPSAHAPTPTPTPTTTKEKKDSLRESKEKPPAKRGTRLPDDWKPPTEYIDFATGKEMTNDQAIDTADTFRNYWIAKPGQGGVKLDWFATWRNWVKNDITRNGLPGARSGGGAGRKRQDAAGIVEVAQRVYTDLGGK